MVAEREMGKRLTVKTVSKDSEKHHVATFTSEISQKEEWYLHLELARSDEEGRGPLRRVLQLRHGKTGQYLSCEDNGRVKCVSTPSDSTWWWMERGGAKNSQATGKNSLPSSSESASDESTEFEYVLISKKYPLRRLCYSKGFDESDETFILIASKKKSTEPSIWTLKFTSGELCFMANPVVHHQMRCDPNGTLSLTSESNGWEVFRFIEVGNGDLYISSWTQCTKFLSSNTDGEIYITDMKSTFLGYSERWRLEVPPHGNGLYIRNVSSQRYLSVGRTRSEPLWTTTKPNDYALWHMNAPHSHIYYLTSLFALAEKQADDGSSTETAINDSSQTYFEEGIKVICIRSSKKGPSLSQKKGNKEEWKMEMTPEGFVTFFSVSHEKYLGCNSMGDVHTTTSNGAWTLWRMESSSHGGVTLLSKEHLRYLAVTKVNGLLCTTKGKSGTNSWRMDPRLPRIASGSTGGYFTDVMGLTPDLVIPFAVLGAAEAAEALSPINSRAQSSERSEDTKDSKEHNLAAQRPISAWKFWAESDLNSPSSLVSPSSVESPKYVTETTSDSPDEVNETATPKEAKETASDGSEEAKEITSDDPEESNETTTDGSEESNETTSDVPEEVKIDKE